MNAPGSSAQAQPPTGAIIIPAHDEESVISRTLARLRPLLGRPGIDVLVVCNGCTDGTADSARAFPGVTVLEIEEPSKPAAMNAGDRGTSRWPRLYLDADIDVEPDAVLAVFAELTRTDGPLAARPASKVDTSRTTFPVRAYYRARDRIADTEPHLWGAGAYAVSRRGHDRIGAFPALTADDFFVDSAFASSEKAVVSTRPTIVRAPHDAPNLISILTRHRRGVAEIGGSDVTSSRVRSLIRSIRGVPEGIDVGVYVLLTVAARLRSRTAGRKAASGWESDRTTRTGGTPTASLS